ncbi:MAG: cytochrome C oxidase subunit IV family protein [Campylobacterales bacterium]|nr:cytochrome C oxidase subunit IV family protein [Campylobacterales bacterium]
MDTNTNVNYKSEYAGYWKVLVGLLVLTAVTFVQPGMFLTDYTFAAQLIIGAIKAWMILMYYMHLKGEKLIGAMGVFSLFLVAVFFIIVIIDVNNFQFGDVSHITSPAK